ncbi:MAG: DUF1559 domain-containing protein [Singulisphaera sp.]
MHILSYMDEERGERSRHQGHLGTRPRRGLPLGQRRWPAVDLGNRRPDYDNQSPMRKFMRCPTAESSNVMYANLSTENLLKANYVACWGGGAYVDGTPDGYKALSGIFGVVPITQKYPIGERFAHGKGTKIAEITDGTSNTVMYSEILSYNQPTGAVTSSMPAGSNRDVRGAMLIPMAGGNNFMTNFPPNSPGTDAMPSCEETIPATSVLKCRRTGDRTYDGLYWAAARSVHPGGVNTGMGDGSVRFIKNTINKTVWQNLGTKGGGEVVSADSY